MSDASLILSRRDLDFILYEWLEVERLTQRARFADHDRVSFDGVLDTCAQLAADMFAPHNRKADQNEPTFDGERVTMIPEVAEALAAFREAGLFSASQDYELGGLQLPNVIERAGFAWFQAANVGTAAYPFLTIGAANLLKTHGTAAQIDAYVRPMLEGRFFGTMCLSEPQAGSSLGDIRTRAVPQADGSYRLFGSKMWISGGDHDLSETIVHMVLARMEGAPVGVKGISLFVVPKHLLDENGAPGERNDVVLAGLNHKMGYRGTTNTLLNFGEGRFTPGGRKGAVGYLVGKPGLDGHSNGAEQIATRARACGMEVVYDGIRSTPEEIVRRAKESRAHVVGLSILSGSHLDLVQEVIRVMRAEGLGDIPVVAGGIIPPDDALILKQMGVARIYTPKDFKITPMMGDVARTALAAVEERLTSDT